MKCLFVAALLLAAVPAAAAPIIADGEAVQMLNRGEWVDAGTAGRKEGGPIGQTVAARAALVRAAYFAGSRSEAVALVNDADRLLATAVEDAPSEFYVQLVEASAVGYRATLEQSRTLGLRTKALMTRLTVEHPERPEGWLALGAWHGEAVIQLGGFIARTVLGASRAQMEQNLATAAQRDPADPLAPAYRGLMLIRMGDADAALPFLKRAAALKARDAYEAMYRRKSLAVVKLIEAGNAKAARKQAAISAPFARLSVAEAD